MNCGSCAARTARREWLRFPMESGRKFTRHRGRAGDYVNAAHVGEAANGDEGVNLRRDTTAIGGSLTPLIAQREICRTRSWGGDAPRTRACAIWWVRCGLWQWRQTGGDAASVYLAVHDCGRRFAGFCAWTVDVARRFIAVRRRRSVSSPPPKRRVEYCGCSYKRARTGRVPFYLCADGRYNEIQQALSNEEQQLLNLPMR